VVTGVDPETAKRSLESAKLLQIHNPNTLLWQLHNSTPKIVHFKKLKKKCKKKGGTAALLCLKHLTFGVNKLMGCRLQFINFLLKNVYMVTMRI